MLFIYGLRALFRMDWAINKHLNSSFMLYVSFTKSATQCTEHVILKSLYTIHVLLALKWTTRVQYKVAYNFHKLKLNNVNYEAFYEQPRFYVYNNMRRWLDMAKVKNTSYQPNPL